MEFFGNETVLADRDLQRPEASRIGGGHASGAERKLMTPIGGGVQIEALMAIKPENLLADEEGKRGQGSTRTSS